jgi:hypothetical protein
LKLITEDCGLLRTVQTVPFFNSRCRDNSYGEKDDR